MTKKLLEDKPASLLTNPGFLALVLLGSSMVWTLATLAWAPVSDWAQPAVVPRPPGSMTGNALAVDTTGTLHVFWSGSAADDVVIAGLESEEQNRDIFYSTWNATSWSDPVNIISGSGAVFHPRVALDDLGRLHMVWNDVCLKYSWAHISEARSARVWMNRAKCIADLATTQPAIVANDSLGVLVAYTTGQGSVQLVQSDGGDAPWSAPETVGVARAGSNSTEAAVYTGHPALTVDSSRTIHVTWSSYPNRAYPPLGLFYAHRIDGDETWSAPFELGPMHHTQAALAVVDGRTVVAVWNGDVGLAGRYARISEDGGRTWSPMEVILPQTVGGGMTESPGIAIDGVGTAHVMVASDEWVFYTCLENGHWTPPVQLPPPLPDFDGRKQVKIDLKHQETNSPFLAIVGGNQLCAVWAAAKVGLFYSCRDIAAPATSPRPVATNSATVTPTPKATVEAIRTSTALVIPRPTLLAYRGQISRDFNEMPPQWIPFVIAVASAVGGILAVILLQSLFFRK